MTKDSKVMDTSSEEFFEAIYRQAADPWNFATSAYERDRYTSIMKLLSGRRYHRAFEPGCSIGVLTERLAGICDSVEAVDLAPTAVAKAIERCGHLANVRIAQGSLPGAIPSGNFDLIVLSEIGYYFSADLLLSVSTRLVSQLTCDGALLAAHWLGHSPDHRLSGDEVHSVLAKVPGLTLEAAERHAGFRLDQWIRK